MNLLLQDPNIAEIVPILNPSSGNYEASVTTTAATMPPANQYLYLVWDLRETTQSQLCYSATTPADACCGCNFTCTEAWFGPMQSTQSLACTTNVGDPGSIKNTFHGTGSVPQIGEVCFNNNNCNFNDPLPSGFYIVANANPGPFPKTWIEIGNNGAVIDGGTC